MKYFQTLAMLTAICLGLIACTAHNPNPELSDPIYKDLSAKHDSHKKTIEETKKRLIELEKDLDRAETHSLELKNAQRDIAGAREELLQAEQWLRYYRIRAERRKVMGRAAYRAAIAKGESWPPKGEYSDYLVNIRLREASLNWNKRVPKLQSRTETDRKPAKDGKTAENSPPRVVTSVPRRTSLKFMAELLWY